MDLVRLFSAKVLSCEWLQDWRDCMIDLGGCAKASVDVVGCLACCPEAFTRWSILY